MVNTCTIIFEYLSILDNTLILCLGNVLQVGDHIPWHRPLNDACQDSKIQHMLITDDPEIPSVETPYGNLSFRQVRSI